MVFYSIHPLSHPSIHAIEAAVVMKFVWPSIKNDCRKWAKTCLQCHKSKIHRRIHVPMGLYLLVSRRFDEVHLDIIGTLLSSEEKRFCVTLINKFNRWA
ncbi:integrase catalytic domain-containing protein [Nephila pilipes]|uniref:Integrase catalytic domain-containing protein n=1 Tax=Nephila pilipes TaxID=299642 RepID=A0A8X6QA54_NEPPI|nr:integrase catalytic domain-containing protein [Nephila pilipes]